MHIDRSLPFLDPVRSASQKIATDRHTRIRSTIFQRSTTCHHESRSRSPRMRDRIDAQNRFSYAFSRFPRTESTLGSHASMSRVLSLSFGALKPTYTSIVESPGNASSAWDRRGLPRPLCLRTFTRRSSTILDGIDNFQPSTSSFLSHGHYTRERFTRAEWKYCVGSVEGLNNLQISFLSIVCICSRKGTCLFLILIFDLLSISLKVSSIQLLNINLFFSDEEE